MNLLPGRVNVFLGTIQEFNAVFFVLLGNEAQNLILGISIDSAYYIPDLQFPYPLYYSMMTFPAFVGRF